MPDAKISELVDAGAPQATDQLLLARTGATLSLLFSGVASQFDAVGAAAAAQAASQPLDSDLTAIAALTTTAFGRGLLALADAAALRSAAELGTAALSASGDFDAAGAASAAQAASQPVDSDLTAIAALTTTSYGRAFLALADAAAGRTALGLGTLATQSGTFSGTSSGTNTGDQTTVSGNAGTATALQTARNIDGQAFDGTGDITVVAPGAHAATSKATPVDADELPLVDSAASNVLKKLTWANLKATLKTYFDSLYLMTVVRSAGTSTSGTATTQVAAITAAASTQLVGWTISAAQTNAAGTQLKVIVTYSDTTTDSDTTVAATATLVVANAGGIERITSGAHAALVVLAAKAVTGLRVETAGTGTGTRSAAISAIQVPV